MKEEKVLVDKVKQGDRRAFNELYRTHYSPVCAYATLMLSSDEAEDVVQDVFLNVWIHRERLDASYSFRSYLLRSVYNASLNIIKRNKYATNYSSNYKKEIEELGYQHYDPDTNEVIRTLYARDLNEQLHQAIESLPPKCKEVFRLSYLQEMPSKAISEKLGISLSTVENHIYSALKQLRVKLKKYSIVLVWLFSKFI